MVNKIELEKKGMRLGKYELGRTLGEGNFGKVKFAKNIETGQSFAVKILEKNKIIHLNITDQVLHFFIHAIMGLLQNYIFYSFCEMGMYSISPNSFSQEYYSFGCPFSCLSVFPFPSLNLQKSCAFILSQDILT